MRYSNAIGRLNEMATEAARGLREIDTICERSGGAVGSNDLILRFNTRAGEILDAEALEAARNRFARDRIALEVAPSLRAPLAAPGEGDQKNWRAPASVVQAMIARVMCEHFAPAAHLEDKSNKGNGVFTATLRSGDRLLRQQDTGMSVEQLLWNEFLEVNRGREAEGRIALKPLMTTPYLADAEDFLAKVVAQYPDTNSCNFAHLVYLSLNNTPTALHPEVADELFSNGPKHLVPVNDWREIPDDT